MFPPPVEPHRLLLRGRDRWVELCHPLYLDCAGCMLSLARYFAYELEHDVAASIDRPAAVYIEILDGRCTLEQARELRRLVVLECYRRPELAHELTPDLFLVDDDFLPAAPAQQKLGVAA